MSRLLLLRHGQSTWNAEDRFQGWADPPLSTLGEQQAMDAAAGLSGLGFTRVCSSDLQRARRTAEVVGEALGLGQVVVEQGLRERNVGTFEGRTAAENRVAFPECFDAETGKFVAVPPDGEDDTALWARVLPVVIELCGRFPGETLLVVTHGGVIRTLERRVGADVPPSTPNLGGRWFDVDGDQLTAGEPFVPVQPELVTAPVTE